LVFFKGFSGTKPGFWSRRAEIVLENKPQKTAVFFIQSQVWGLFSEVYEEYEEYEAPKESEAPKEPVKNIPQSTL
jgi:hypothetical protein